MLSAGNPSRQAGQGVRRYMESWRAWGPGRGSQDGSWWLLSLSKNVPSTHISGTDGCRCVWVTTVAETISLGTGIPKSQGQEKARTLSTTLYLKKAQRNSLETKHQALFVITFNTGIVLQTSVSLAIHTANTQKRKEQELISSLAGTLQPNTPVPSTLTAFPQDKQT